MPNTKPPLSRRERQIMDILYRRQRATANEVMISLSGNPHYSTVRTQLRILEEKGYVRHEEEHLKYVYLPVMPRHELGQSLLMQVIDGFYDGSMENVVAALLGHKAAKVSRKELDRIANLVEQARKGAKR
jgi:BlaI family transcriptional regulator, penicillinase repressor